MMEDTTGHIKQWQRCLRFRAVPNKAPVENVDATYPIELVHMDYLTIEANEGVKHPYFGDNRSFLTVCTSYCHKLADSQMYSSKFMGQIPCPFWAS